MKKLFLFSFLLMILFNLSAQTKLLNYSVQSFGEISRLELVFDKKTSISLRKEAQNQRFVITLPNASNTATKSKNYNIPTLSSVHVQTLGNQMTIIVKTQKNFAEIRESVRSGKNYVMAFDVINTLDPTTFNDYLSFAKYYKTIGNTGKMNYNINKAKSIDPKNPKLNEFNSKKETKKVKDKKPEVKKETKKKTEPLKEKPAQDIKKIEKPKDPVPSELKNPEPEKKVETKIEKTASLPDSIKSKAIVMQRPMRKPVNRPDLIKTKEIPKKIVPADTTKIEKKQEIPVQKVEAKTSEPLVKQEVILEKVIAPNKNAQLLLDLYESIQTDSTQQHFMIAKAASQIGANKEAIEFLKKIPKASPLKNQANKELYEIYKKIGNDIEAKLLLAEMTPDSVKAEKTDLMNTPVKAWMALAFAGLILIITAILTSIILHAKYKKTKPKISDSEFEIHKQHLQRAYENKDAYVPDEVEPPVQEDRTPPPPRFNATIIDDYDNPPLISENLEKEEEQELLKDEEEDFITIIKKDKKPSESFDDENDSFADDEYKKKMILKLYNDGWAIEEISKELQISQREIEFIIKMAE